MIKKYKEFIFEDEDNGEETPSASATARVPVIAETFNGSNPMHP